MDRRVALQEVPLAYVEKESEALFRVRSKITHAPAHAPPSNVAGIGGGFVLQSNRFVSYRAIGKQVLLWESVVHDGKAEAPGEKASLSIQLPESVAPNGIRVFESLDKQYVSICVVTCAKTIHRFCYKIEANLFASEGRDEVAFPMTSLPLHVAISAVCWLDECNVVVGADDGSMIAVNVGLSIFGHTQASYHEVALADQSGLSWLWGTRKKTAVLRIIPIPDQQNDGSDTLVLSLSADAVIRVWSYEQLSCLCSQEFGEALGLDKDQLATAASIVFVPEENSSHRVLIHTTSPYTSNDIIMLRGDITAKSIELDIARRFVADIEPSVRLVDMAIDNSNIYAVWRSADNDYSIVYPLTLTGPKKVSGEQVASWTNADDDIIPADLTENQQIDSFFFQRLLSRYNEECLRQTLALLSNQPVDGVRLRRAFLDIVHRRWSLKDSKRADPIALRTAVWQDVLATAHKQWVRENIPMGLVACSLSISPILVRRNHLSIFFPSTNSLISQSSELRDTILPTFASFPASKLYASLIKEWQADVQPDVVPPMNLSEALQAGILKDINNGRGIPSMLARLSTILTGDASTQIAVLDALLDHVKLPSATAVTTPVTSVDLSLALHRMSTVVVQELWTTSCRSAFLLGFLLDAQPPFLAAETLAHIESTTLPNLLTTLQTWGFGKWILTQQHANAVPILQDFASHMLDDILSTSTGLGAAVTSFLRELLFEQNSLVAYLKTHKLYSLLRVTLRQLLSHADQALTTQYTFLLAECLLVEGAHTENEESKLVCLDRAVRYFVLVAHADTSVIVEITSKLKEHLHRASSKYIIDFLRSSLINIEDSVTQEFVWYNLFKLMIQEAEYQDAYSALQHLARLGTSAESLEECVRHFVLQLCDAGRHDVICEFSWGAFEPQVEDLLVWQAANTHANVPVSRSSQSASSLYRLLYSFYMQRSRYVHAARAMYSLFLRLQAETFSTSVLETQRDALLATLNVLQLAPEEHRWFACNLQAEQNEELTVISEADVNRQLLSVRGMLALPSKCFAMGTLAAPEIISLLLTNLDRNARLATKASELAVAIAQAHELDLSVVIRSLSRAFATGTIAEQVVEVVLEHLNDTALYLTAIESLIQLRFAIPTWLHEHAMENGQALLALYLKYGALDDAMATAHTLIPVTINLSTTEFEQVAKKYVSTWIPYALLDTLLESTKRVVAEHEAQGKTTEIAQLKQDAAALTTKLGAYFKLVKALDATTQSI